MLRALAFATLCLAAVPAAAAVLYKSVDANGTLTFSDVPPEPGARILETRRLPSVSEPAAPVQAAAIAPQAPEQTIDYEAALARANAQLDQAEHALAIARRDFLSAREGLRLGATRMTPADEARVEFLKRNVAAARQNLMELLRAGQQLALRQ